MAKTWILVADAHRARCFERAALAAELVELADFVFPQQRHARLPGKGDVSGDAGKGHGRTAHAGTQFEPRSSTREIERHAFARDLVDYLNDGVSTNRCSALVLIAPAPMLGEIRGGLSPAADKAVTTTASLDLTRCQGRELQQRVDAAMELPD